MIGALAAVACASGDAPNERKQVPEWTAEPTVRAGGVDGPGALAAVFRVAVGPADEILAAQPRPPTISVFDADGRFLRTVGRTGPGPGEFRQLGGIGWTEDTLWTIDFGRVHLFDSTLRFVRTVAPPMPDPPADVDRVVPGPLMADGSILGIPVSFGGAKSEPVLLLGQDGSIRRVLAHVSSEGRAVRVDLGAGPASTVSNPWPDFPLWRNAADGRSLIVVERPVASGPDGATFQIVRVGLNGDTLVDRVHTYAPLRLEEGTRDRTYRTIAERIARNRSTTVAAVGDALREALTAPPFHPPVTELVAGRDGTIWLRREEVRTDSVTWEVYSETGESAGRVRLPSSLEVHVAEAGRVWGVVRDSLDVPFVQVYRVVPSE